MLHMELSAEVVEGEEGVGEHQVLPGGLGVQNLSQQLLPISAEHIGAPAQQSHIPAHQL